MQWQVVHLYALRGLRVICAGMLFAYGFLARRVGCNQNLAFHFAGCGLTFTFSDLHRQVKRLTKAAEPEV